MGLVPLRRRAPRTTPGDVAAAAPLGASPWSGLARAVVVAVFFYFAWYQSLDFTAVLMLGFIWAIAAIGLALVLGSAGQMMLCQASFMLIGAYAYGWLTTEESVPTVLAAVAAAIVTGAAAVVLFPVLRLRGYTFALGTIAAGLLVTQVFTTGNWLPGGNFGLANVPSLNLGFTVLVDNAQYMTFALVLLAFLVVVLHQAFGRGFRRRAVQFIHHDEDLLGSVGGNAIALKRTLFLVAAALGGLAGAVYVSAFTFIRPDALGIFESFALALVVVLGGNGRLLGAVLGAVVYQASFTILGDERVEFRFALLGAIVIVMIHFFPYGLLPARAEFVRWLPVLRQRPRRAAGEVPADDPEPPLGVTLSGVTKRFGALTAVSDLTVQVQPGTLVGLVGPNGAGKSTLLDVIASSPATHGQVRIGDHDVALMEPWQRARLGMARTYQRVRLIPTLSVLDNVMAGCDLWAARGRALTEADRVAVARAAIDEVGLTERADDSVEALSFGNRRLVELARVIAGRPRLVLLDEPSSGLNDAEVEAFAAIVRGMHARGCTIILVEHNMPLVQRLVHEVIAMDRGALLAHGETTDVFSLPAFREAYIGRAAEAAA
jgi:ABC-type branched-subunit amino acid transport system ATPase component/ABC-type branched-subunit amino acid transport system permease subunit